MNANPAKSPLSEAVLGTSPFASFHRGLFCFILIGRNPMAYTTLLSGKKAEIAAICRRHHVRELSLFGSALGPDFRPDSDIDLLVEFDSGASVGLLQFGELQAELEILLNRKVDLVSKRGLRPLVRENVLHQTEAIYTGHS
jgi:uncharacterized protein